MNKNSSMMPYFNKITDLFKTRVYVDKGPLEQSTKKEININEVKPISILQENSDTNSSTNNNYGENLDEGVIDINSFTVTPSYSSNSNSTLNKISSNTSNTNSTISNTLYKNYNDFLKAEFKVFIISYL
jgi:hypothetical protein